MLHFDSLNKFWPSPIQPMHRPNPCPAFRGWGLVRSSLRVSRGGGALSFPCRHAASRLPAWFWHTAVIYHYSYSTVTAPFPCVATIPPYFTLASLHFLFTSLSLHPRPHPPPLYQLLLYMPTVCQYSCTISSYAGFETRDDAYDVTLLKKIIIVYLILWTFLSRDLSHF